MILVDCWDSVGVKQVLALYAQQALSNKIAARRAYEERRIRIKELRAGQEFEPDVERWANLLDDPNLAETVRARPRR